MTATEAASRRLAVSAPSFNIWHEPWIDVADHSGRLSRLGIRACLERSHELTTLHEPSPLVVTGIHRLLAAILQSIATPATVRNLADLLAEERLHAADLDRFQGQWADRFDIFSADAPFMQTSDILLTQEPDDAKSVASLAPEIPTATEVTHWRHEGDTDHRFCPRCCAGGLTVIPAFAAAGGSGIKPSINGVPPLYVMPQGRSLFETLVLSLVTPAYQPKVAASVDTPIWQGTTVVPKGSEVPQVGYLESLTFPARRMRLFPLVIQGACSRCGARDNLFVRQMAFQMGVSRPKGSPAWLDPFVAYRLRGDKPPAPVRPTPGKAVWREYSTLFVAHAQPNHRRPAVVDQLERLAEHGAVDQKRAIVIRCAGLRTDMKAKVFEWADASLQLSPALLRDESALRLVDLGSQWAEDLADSGRGSRPGGAPADLRDVVRKFFDPNPKSRRWERAASLYWGGLDEPFRTFVLTTLGLEGVAESAWVNAITSVARSALDEVINETGDRGADLRVQAQARRALHGLLTRKRKEWMS
jgi:CRISPR system Cascade subunit CasA